ncbi:hypothetical protein ACGF3C_32950 [Micromonospora sp. NPDC047762]|uniref:hypothetical protein n=1 Tax=Micromonospora sp. NPDC047762 TaxID=3364255 RepID=UPI0037207B3A
MPYHFTAYASDLAAYKLYLESLFGVTYTLGRLAVDRGHVLDLSAVAMNARPSALGPW